MTVGVTRAEDGRPNLIVILADDLGYGDLGCFGSEVMRTPQLDRLAAEGMRLTDFHAAAPVCSPTRAALLTGRYPQRAGIDGVVYAAVERNRHHGLFPSETTFVDLLGAMGYRTGIVGKWHLGYRKRFHPIRHGFDVFEGYVSGNVDYFSHVDGEGYADWWEGDALVEREGYSTHLITEAAVAFIEREQAGPFCLYIAHEAPHTPFQGPGDEAFRVVGRKVQEQRTEKEKRRAYREMIEEMDRGVGEVMQAVRRCGLAERTMVFFFSDNGATRYGSNGVLRGHKGSLWEGGQRVPAIAWWPGRIEAGSTCEEMAMAVDLLPTMVEAAGGHLGEEVAVDGVSLVGMLTEGERMPERAMFWEYQRQRAMREGRWKLATGLRGGDAVALYDLANDLGEQRNVASEHPERVRRMTAALEAWAVEVREGATVQPARDEE